STERGFQVRPSNPPDFDGDREKGQPFLNSCSLYFSIAGSAFQNKKARISWALTFFKTGQAASFADQILRTQSHMGKPYFANWAAFELEFKKHFMPWNRQVTAITQLEGSSWYQGSDSVDEYTNWFHELVFHSGYVDEANLVVKFKKGLSKSLRMTVVTMDPPPAFDDLEAWIEAAQRVADVRETSKAPTTVPRMMPPAPPVRTFNYQARLPIPAASTRHEPTQAPDGPVPMDVDWTGGKASISNIVCRHCGKTGHIARFCDTIFDVRNLTIEEKEELVYELMA
ncbi:hypothetical protein M422DRAFT_89836, partial [Sphaerobolus stellatus SS14]